MSLIRFQWNCWELRDCPKKYKKKFWMAENVLTQVSAFESVHSKKKKKNILVRFLTDMRLKPTSRPSTWIVGSYVDLLTRSFAPKWSLSANRRRGWAAAPITCLPDLHHLRPNSDLVQTPPDRQVSETEINTKNTPDLSLSVWTMWKPQKKEILRDVCNQTWKY